MYLYIFVCLLNLPRPGHLKRCFTGEALTTTLGDYIFEELPDRHAPQSISVPDCRVFENTTLFLPKLVRAPEETIHVWLLLALTSLEEADGLTLRHLSDLIHPKHHLTRAT